MKAYQNIQFGLFSARAFMIVLVVVSQEQRTFSKTLFVLGSEIIRKLILVFCPTVQRQEQKACVAIWPRLSLFET